MTNQTRTLKQLEIAHTLALQFDIDADRVLFLHPEKPDEPWLSAEALITIARQSGQFQAVDETFREYIEKLNQIVHSATVLDKDGRTFTRSGVATIGEREELDAHALAAGRAVGAALTAAGFNPLRPGSLVSVSNRQPPATADESRQVDEAQSRRDDLKRIHVIAERKGLILPLPERGWDRSKYRQFLAEHYRTNSAAGFNSVERASLINALERLPDAIEDEFADVA